MGDEEQKKGNGRKEATTKNKYAVACSIIGSVISILMGYDTGVMSGAMLFIKEDMKTNDTQVQVLAGILNVFALVGSLTAGRVSDWVGRRRTISLAACIFLAGSVLMGLSPNFGTLLTGRCVAGVGVGYALMIAPVYAAEIASSEIRGSLTSLPEICISFGILLGYVANYLLAKLPLVYGWRAMLGLGALPSAVLAVAVLAMPESPRWLVMQGRVDEAVVVLRRVCDPGEVDVRLAEIKAAAGLHEDAAAAVLPGSGGGKGVWKEMFVHPTPPVRRILLAAFGVHFFQHLTGIEAVVLYSPRIFKAAGIATTSEVLVATIGVGVTKTVFILTAILLVDCVGRRPLYLSSLSGIIASLACLGLGLTVIERSKQQHHAPTWAVALAIATVFTFIASFSVGVGPITWAYSSEVYPLRLRAQGASVGVAINRVMNAAVSMTFVSLYKAVTIGGAFFLFAGLAVVAAAFFYLACPETQGRPLEEIEEVFSRGWRERLGSVPQAAVELPVSMAKPRQ
ncbi:hypothetical protein PR202_gb29894 [Eleusine coracana subsp. coracana]|uniref:Major facilitator superfamily (MFS) profile domain-containing protein n=1 Tax=Eleusine coracana subsp. coracana TaxID=191504 RepID=A0AAV5G1B9_ELECO|nr:hypothetical protein QOZ80_2BG0176920 [Eleusine coracana subsp. coracana]GJN40647.1 hypothetical protein PR202_gb29894 [Eleusine coracana subsp. coracana]